MFSFTLDIYCTSVRPGRGIPHMWLSLRFLLSFYLLKGFFSSFSLLLLRVKVRGCHTLLKPYETNCGLWIWAIQIKFDWLIDWQLSRLPSCLVTSLRMCRTCCFWMSPLCPWVLRLREAWWLSWSNATPPFLLSRPRPLPPTLTTSLVCSSRWGCLWIVFRCLSYT